LLVKIIGDGWAGLSLALFLGENSIKYQLCTRSERKKPHTTGGLVDTPGGFSPIIETILEKNTVCQIDEWEFRHRGKALKLNIPARMLDVLGTLHQMRHEALKTSEKINNPDLEVIATGATGAKRVKGIKGAKAIAGEIVLGAEYTVQSREAEKRLIFDLDAVPVGTGYGWVFGYGDRKAKIGMLSHQTKQIDFKKLGDYLDTWFTEYKVISKMTGVTTSGVKHNVIEKNGPHKFRIYIGDSACQIHPWSYEGIRPAMLAADMLTRAIKADDIDLYQRWHIKRFAHPNNEAIALGKMLSLYPFSMTRIGSSGFKEILEGGSPIEAVLGSLIGPRHQAHPKPIEKEEPIIT
jgi:hypothetical protein